MCFRLSLFLLLAPLLLGNPIAQRYLPYVEDQSIVEELVAVQQSDGQRGWRGADELRRLRAESGEALPLAGLRLAIDPGHLGGEWAEFEGRNFRISEQDYWVREGELVLEVAQRIRQKLTELGAEVLLLREDSTPLNQKSPSDYVEAVVNEMESMTDGSLIAMADYALEVRRRAIRRSIVVGELATRARIVNEDFQPDALLSLHINAARWPLEDGVEQIRLVEGNHLHLLIFGCLSSGELARNGQRDELIRKLVNGSGTEESALAASLAECLAEATMLPPSQYDGRNAIRPDEDMPYVWARNLMLLRQVECPVVLLEPYVANSTEAYPRFQAALASRARDEALAEDDILVEYADAVVAGVMKAYGARKTP